MQVVAVRMQEGDGDRLDPLFHERAGLGLDVVARDGDRDPAVVTHALAHLPHQAARNQDVGPVGEEVVGLIQAEPAQLQDVAKPRGGEQPASRAIVLEQGVHRERGAVREVLDVGRLYAVAGAALLEAGDDGALGTRGGRRLQRIDGAALPVHDEEVGEGPADVDADPVACSRITHAVFASLEVSPHGAARARRPASTRGRGRLPRQPRGLFSTLGARLEAGAEMRAACRLASSPRVREYSGGRQVTFERVRSSGRTAFPKEGRSECCPVAAT